VKPTAAFLFALIFLTAGSLYAEPDTASDLLLTVGKSTIVESPLTIERIAVGFGDVAEGVAVNPHEVLLNAKTPGVTSLIIWQQGGTRQLFNVKVVASRFLTDNRAETIRNEIAKELPDQNIDLSFENDTVFLRGTVKDMISADRALSIASALGKTINLLYVDTPPAVAQILLKVRFASVDRSNSTQLGMNIFSTGATNTLGSVGTRQFAPNIAPPLQNPTTSTTISDALNLFLFRPDLNLGATIQALQQRGLLQILSEPNVLAENGKQASFLAGGEFPFPSVSASTGGTPIVSIQFREYGVRLTFTPVITPRGTIHLQVAPEVSALDFTNGLSISGFNVPALTTRKMSTQVELNEGQSFAIGGLLDNRTSSIIEKIPFLGDIPVLGKFFQSKSVSKQNTELIVIVTPELVHPVPAGQPIAGPDFPTPFLGRTRTESGGSGPNVIGGVIIESAVPVIPASVPIERLEPRAQPAEALTSGVLPAPATGSAGSSFSEPLLPQQSQSGSTR
jgi:pilus assembly protein CpaC